MDINATEYKSILATSTTRTEASIAKCSDSLLELQDRISKNTWEICKGNSLGRRLCSRVQWIGNLCGTLKEMLYCVIRGNCAVYQELLCLKRLMMSVPRSCPSSISGGEAEEPVMFEDACGAVVPLPLALVNSWEVFQDVLESRFRGRPGLSKLRRKEYGLREQGTDRRIPFDGGGDIRDALVPGTRIAQEMLFHEDDVASLGDVRLATCPFCHKGGVGSKADGMRLTRWYVPLMIHLT